MSKSVVIFEQEVVEFCGRNSRGRFSIFGYSYIGLNGTECSFDSTSYLLRYELICCLSVRSRISSAKTVRVAQLIVPPIELAKARHHSRPGFS